MAAPGLPPIGPGQRPGYMRSNNYLTELGTARAISVVQDRLSDNTRFRIGVKGCLLATTSLNHEKYSIFKRKSNTQLQIEQNGGPRGDRNSGMNFTLHRTAYLAHYGRDIRPGNVASHLCDEPSCFLYSHISDESQGVNLSRRTCPGDIFCTLHNHMIYDCCFHNPKCIKLMPPDRFKCCLSQIGNDPALPALEHPVPSSSSSSSLPSNQAQSSIQYTLNLDPTQAPGADQLELEGQLGWSEPLEMTEDDYTQTFNDPQEDMSPTVSASFASSPPVLNRSEISPRHASTGPLVPPAPMSPIWISSDAGLPPPRSPIQESLESTSSDIRPPPKRRRLTIPSESSQPISPERPESGPSTVQPHTQIDTQNFIVGDEDTILYDSDADNPTSSNE